MPDITGYRAKVGVIVPSTNTVVEHDTALLRPHGVTFHTGRMRITDPRMDSNANFEALILQIREAISAALDDVMTAKPDVMMMGMSGETFWGGAKGHDAFHERVVEATGGLQVTTGAAACRAALEALGVKRIAVFSPYQPVADEQVIRYFTEVGFEIDSSDAQAIVQVGTNLSMIGIAEQAEHWLGKPVVAINAATIWHTLRSAGFNDTWAGAGRLLREF